MQDANGEGDIPIPVRESDREGAASDKTMMGGGWLSADVERQRPVMAVVVGRASMMEMSRPQDRGRAQRSRGRKMRKMKFRWWWSVVMRW